MEIVLQGALALLARGARPSAAGAARYARLSAAMTRREEGGARRRGSPGSRTTGAWPRRDVDAELARVVAQTVVVHAEPERPRRRCGEGGLVADGKGHSIPDPADERPGERRRDGRVGSVAPLLRSGWPGDVSPAVLRRTSPLALKSSVCPWDTSMPVFVQPPLPATRTRRGRREATVDVPPPERDRGTAGLGKIDARRSRLTCSRGSNRRVQGDPLRCVPPISNRLPLTPGHS